MRKLMKTKLIRISEENFTTLEQDKKHFQKTIGGGKWSLNDTITEYLKILTSLKTKPRTIKYKNK